LPLLALNSDPSDLSFPNSRITGMSNQCPVTFGFLWRLYYADKIN
jgi:hypothetical protein